MSYEILHFRGSEKLLTDNNLMEDAHYTFNYIDFSLSDSHYKDEILRQALGDLGWRDQKLSILDGRRYQYKGLKRRIAIEGNFSSYEYILNGLCRLQIGYDKNKFDTAILMLNSIRGDRSPYGSTSELIKNEIEDLFPTISMPVTIVLFSFEPQES